MKKISILYITKIPVCVSLQSVTCHLADAINVARDLIQH